MNSEQLYMVAKFAALVLLFIVVYYFMEHSLRRTKRNSILSNLLLPILATIPLMISFALRTYNYMVDPAIDFLNSLWYLLVFIGVKRLIK